MHIVAVLSFVILVEGMDTDLMKVQNVLWRYNALYVEYKKSSSAKFCVVFFI